MTSNGGNTRSRLYLQRTVVVTMAVVRMMQVAVHQVVHVISVLDLLVTTTRTVHMAFFVTTARMVGRAIVGIAGRHLQRTFVDVIAMNVMQMTVV